LGRWREDFAGTVLGSPAACRADTKKSLERGVSPPTTQDRQGAREALIATAGLLLSLWVGKHVARVGFSEVIFTAIAAFQLYVPLWLIQRRGELPESHAIHAHGLILGPIAALRARLVRRRRRRHFRGRPSPVASWLAHYGRGASLRASNLWGDLRRAAVVALLTFPLFALSHHLWQEALGHPWRGFRVPPDLVSVWAKNTLLIALPEELFYRGFVETRLERVWPTTKMVWGLPLGRTVVLASALFALGHFLGEYNPARLGPFFPAFVFSALTRRSGSITGAVVYHGASNAFSHLLAAGYR
jgi:membrane protease YdiL (CAAX protease family)